MLPASTARPKLHLKKRKYVLRDLPQWVVTPVQKLRCGGPERPYRIKTEPRQLGLLRRRPTVPVIRSNVGPMNEISRYRMHARR